jgi:STE24 endopeptidase
MELSLLLIFFYFIYTGFRIWLEFREVRFILKEVQNGCKIMAPAEFLTSAQYALFKHIVEMARSAISFLMVALWLGGGLTLLNYSFFDYSIWSEIEMLFIFFGVNYLLFLPIRIWEKVGEKKFGFWKGDWKLFIIDELKKIALFALLGFPFFYALIYFIENYFNWWFYAFLFTFGAVLLLNLLFPYLASLFNKFEPLKDKELKKGIEELLEKSGFKSDGIFQMDASRRDSRLNAYFSGIGKSKRIVLFDTLLEKLERGEILAVLGHELGHFKNRDILKRLGIVGGILFLFFYLLGHISPFFYIDMNLFENGATLLMVAYLLMEPLFFLFQPLFNYLSRRAEFRADQMGAELGGKKELHSALTKLARENKSFPKTSKLYALFHHTHPTILERLAHLEEESANGEKSASSIGKNSSPKGDSPKMGEKREEKEKNSSTSTPGE